VSEGQEERPQVAWKALEPGAQVFSAEGESVAKLSRVVGDADADVFTGLAITLRALGRERLVDSDRVRGIWPDRIDLDLTKDEIDALPEYHDAPAVRFQPGFSGIFRRLFGRPPR
jgi:hypothetical protein